MNLKVRRWAMVCALGGATAFAQSPGKPRPCSRWGPVTITLPDAGKRFMSLQAISEDHYVPATTIQFGGCDGKIANCIPIMKGWNYTARLYRPRPEILNGKWKFPEAQPVG